MAAPSLRIPLGINMAEFDKGIENAKSHTRQATQFILKQFSEMNAGIGGPAAAGAFAGYGAAALRLVGAFGAVVVAGKLVGDAISAARDRIAEMADVAAKAQDRGVSAEFFQSFISGAKGAEDRITLFEAALERAFQATKPLLNPDWTVWDTGLTKVSAVEKAMRDTRELFTTDQNFSGFDLFKNATNQDQKIRAVLVYMQQLKLIGQDIAALDVGEKMFGAKFTDEVRVGKESFDGMLRTIESGSKTNFISNDAAKNAKDLDDRLKDAHNTINERLKPDWDDLASAVLRIKGVWVEILEAVAKYKATEVKAAPFASDTANDGTNNPDPNSAAFGNPQILNQGRRRRGQLPVLPAAPTVPSEAAALDVYSSANDFSGGPPASEGVPMPRRRPNDAPKPPPVAAVVRDPLQVSVDQIEKRIAALRAETATIDASTAAQERAKTVAILEEAAKRANTAAGLANKDVTAAQRVEIEKEADAMLAAAAAAEKARVASSIRVGQGTAFLTQEDAQIAQQLKGIYGNDIPAALASTEAAALRLNGATREIASTISTNLTSSLADVMDGTKTAGQAFQDFGKIVIRAMEEAIIKIAIVGPMMQALQSSFNSSGLLSLLGLGGGAVNANGSIAGAIGPTSVGGTPLVGAFAGGTDSAPGGLSLIGENGPEIMNVPRGAQIIPNDILRNGGGGGAVYNDNRVLRIGDGASPESVAALTAAFENDRRQRRSEWLQIYSDSKSRGQV